ncbi:DNA cytosine methyltransferase [Pseudomonas viridiflava]|uniref:DNA cytosine methyltransferase n=1 Tax=Pseudomonas viridiflava TaxID=33069 RepID=UPI003C7720FA
MSLHPTLTARGGGSLDDREAYVLEHEGIRRTTPLEWERCQGFPDNYTRLPWKNLPIEKCPDSLRYRSIGNSKSVPVVTWIGQRLILKISQMQDSFPI